LFGVGEICAITINNCMSEYSKLSKDELEELAREDGVELDKRLKKEKLVKQIATPTVAVQGGTNRAKWLAQASVAEIKRWEEDPNNHNPEQGRA